MRANPTDLDQILDNLIDNALIYAPGPVEVEVAPGPTAVVAVRDHGPGIAESERNVVTDRFHRGPGAPAGGSGLGLAIARELTERWGGEFEVVAPHGGGTRVEMRLRRARRRSTDGERMGIGRSPRFRSCGSGSTPGAHGPGRRCGGCAS